jgi:hypothetical protein
MSVEDCLQANILEYINYHNKYEVEGRGEGVGREGEREGEREVGRIRSGRMYSKVQSTGSRMHKLNYYTVCHCAYMHWGHCK